MHVAVVTGGTRGIGRAISVALKGAGNRVAATYVGNDDAARRFTSETGILSFKFDVSDFKACEAGIRAVERELGPVEILDEKLRKREFPSDRRPLAGSFFAGDFPA